MGVRWHGRTDLRNAGVWHGVFQLCEAQQKTPVLAPGLFNFAQVLRLEIHAAKYDIFPKLNTQQIACKA